MYAGRISGPAEAEAEVRSGGMSTQGSDSGQPGGQPVVPISERTTTSLPGLMGIFLALLLIIVGAVVAAQKGGWTPLGILVIVGGALTAAGLVTVAPGEARVVSLFGRYLGTVRTSGLHLVNPFTKRRRISTRIRNHETATLKVNDADGNPIEMAAVVVWQVADTAKAVYAVDDFVEF